MRFEDEDPIICNWCGEPIREDEVNRRSPGWHIKCVREAKHEFERERRKDDDGQ